MLSPDEALAQARELQREFNHNDLLRKRRLIISRGRKLDTLMEELGIQTPISDLIHWESEAPNQEGHLYADALSIAQPDVHVILRSNEPSKTKIGDSVLEPFYQGVLTTLLADDYGVCRNMATAPVGFRRLDRERAYFNGTPKRKRGQDIDEYTERLGDYQREAPFPFTLVDGDPQRLYYIENRERTEVIFAVETIATRESEVREEGSHGTLGELTIIRTPEVMYHFWSPVAATSETNTVGHGNAGVAASRSIEQPASELIYEQENPFGHTGYFLYRGRYTGANDPERRYEPLIMPSLNVAQAKSIFATLQLNFALQAGIHWLESDMPAGQNALAEQLAALEQAKSGGEAALRTSGGTPSPAQAFEEGVHVKFRDIAGDFALIVGMLTAEEERYRFNDVLMGEAASDISGRALIRLQESAGRRLSYALRQRKLTTEAILRVIRHTLFSRREYLGGSKNTNVLYLPRHVEANEMGERPARELVALKAEHNIPHDIQVSIAARSDAAQLAWTEEGVKLAGSGQFPQDVVDRDFFHFKDLHAINRMRVADQVRSALHPAAVADGIQQALQDLGTIPIEKRLLALPPEQPQVGNGRHAAALAASGAPTPVAQEDAALALDAEGGMQPTL